MTRLDRMVLAEIVGPFVGSLFLFTGLFFAGSDLLRFAQYLQQGDGALLVAQMIFYRFPMVIALTAPMAMLLGTLLGFGRLSGDSELTALVAAGVSFERIMAPVAVFGLLVSMVGYWFNTSVVPLSNARGEAIVTAWTKRGWANPNSVNAFDLPPIRDRQGTLTLIHVEGGVDIPTASLRNVSVEVWKNGRLTQVLTGARADWVQGTKNFRLRDGQAVVLGANPMVASLGDATMNEFTLATPEEVAVLQKPVEQVTTSDLRRRITVLKDAGHSNQVLEAQVEIARRAAVPFASLVFAVIGAPLGVSPKRSGKGLGFGMSVLITFVYWIAIQVLSIVARGGSLPPAIALMIPNIVGLIAAFFLTRRVFRA